MQQCLRQSLRVTLVPRSKRTRIASPQGRREGFTLRYRYRYRYVRGASRREDSQFLYAGEPVHRTAHR
ncbi:MAG: hypothetical protein V7K92_06175 [Nostoc sp.]|uniref:hypothetical protein n=1 Tax=Nostoc sp. TaxID=1180 RepID=UPI002FEF193B